MRVLAECALHAFGQEPCNEHSEVSSGGCLTVTAFLSLVAGVVFVHEADPLVIILIDMLFCPRFRYRFQTAELCNFVIVTFVMKLGFHRCGKNTLHKVSYLHDKYN